MFVFLFFFFFQAEDGIRDVAVTGVQTCALPISRMSTSAMHPRATSLAISKTSGTTSRVSRTGMRRLAWLHEFREHRDGCGRSEERRVGKECRSRGARYH